jgi:hypothetical protein
MTFSSSIRWRRTSGFPAVGGRPSATACSAGILRDFREKALLAIESGNGDWRFIEAALDMRHWWLNASAH